MQGLWLAGEDQGKMKTWNRNRVAAGSALVALAILVGTGDTPGNAQGERTESFKNGKPVLSPNGKLVFMLTTGFEDLWEVRMCLEDVKTAKASGYMEDVIWLVRGRGVEVLGRPEGVLTRPSQIVRLAREVKASGVRIIAATDALKQQQIPVANLDPKATELVDNPAMLMADLVSKGYQVIRY
jgi:intracellular sulfur oxidation DsrE/DsrF family protein